AGVIVCRRMRGRKTPRPRDEGNGLSWERRVVWWHVGGGHMDREQMERWEKTRRGGELSFILVWGVLGFGLTLSVAMGCVGYFAHPNHPANDWLPFVFLPVVCVGGGYVFGKGMWAMLEKAYQDAKVKFEILDRAGPGAGGGTQLPSQPTSEGAGP